MKCERFTKIFSRECLVDSTLRQKGVRAKQASLFILCNSYGCSLYRDRPVDLPRPFARRSEQAGHQLTAFNSGTGIAKDLVIADLLPDELEFVNADLAPADRADRQLVWTLPELGPNQKKVIM